MNFMGRLYRTLTGILFCFPGVQFGMDFTTRIASSSQKFPIPRARVTSVMEPSVSTTNDTYTIPAISSALASCGYFRFFRRYAKSSSSPPGNLGISWTEVLGSGLIFCSIVGSCFFGTGSGSLSPAVGGTGLLSANVACLPKSLTMESGMIVGEIKRAYLMGSGGGGGGGGGTGGGSATGGGNPGV